MNNRYVPSAGRLAGVVLLVVAMSGIAVNQTSPGICPDRVRVDVSYSAAMRNLSFHTQYICGSLAQCDVSIPIEVYGVQRAYDVIFRPDHGFARVGLKSPADQPISEPRPFIVESGPTAIPIADKMSGETKITLRVRAPERASGGGALPAYMHYLVVRDLDPADLGLLSIRIASGQ